jgi:hypothetical protein
VTDVTTQNACKDVVFDETTKLRKKLSSEHHEFVNNHRVRH